jgi:predicted alpha/beta-hydrolase family hydrolase
MLLALAMVATSAVSHAADRTVKVMWGTAQHVTAVFSYPAGTQRVPALIIASGRSGGMDTSIIKGFAGKAVRDGMVAVRFNYTYFAAKGTPSEGLVDEVDQFNAVIQEAMKDPRVDPKRLIIAGKSLGSVVAHRIFQQNPSYLGEVLLTPVILTLEDAQRLYPNLPLAGRPTVLIVGNQDVDNAPLGVVYNYLKDASRKVMLDVVAGDHGLEIGGSSDVAKRANAANVDSALDVAQYWVRQIARILPPAAPSVKVSKGTAKPKPKSGAASGG